MKGSSRLRVGTDFSGMETPIIALRSLGVKYQHMFSSDNCPHAKTVILEKFKPKQFFDDALKRNPKDLPKKLDLYIAGFPCQKFSKLNDLTKHHANPNNPLIHFFACVKVIQKCRPTIFVLENVPHLKSVQGGKYFARIKSTLASLKGYRITYMILDARNYGSLQSRKRLFMVGIPSHDTLISLPPKQKPPNKKPFSSILEKGITRAPIPPKRKKRLDACAKTQSHPFFVTFALSTFPCRPSMQRYPPTLMRGGQGIYWSKKKIVTTLREDMRLQGIPDSFNFPSSISNGIGRKMVGNSMSVDVMKCLLHSLLIN